MIIIIVFFLNIDRKEINTKDIKKWKNRKVTCLFTVVENIGLHFIFFSIIHVYNKKRDYYLF